MKKAGIAVDNYKLDKFEERLDEAGFEYETMPFSEDTSFITVKCQQSDYKTLRNICTELELGFKRNN